MQYEKITRNPLTILLVEDNLAHAELVMRSFENHQIANKIYYVSNGEAAKEQRRTNPVYITPVTV